MTARPSRRASSPAQSATTSTRGRSRRSGRSLPRAARMAITLEAVATPENFEESGYLAANPDVAEAVRKGQFQSGWQHFEGHGRKESRLVRFPRSITDIQQEK